MIQKSNSPFENILLASLSVKYSVTKISCQAMLIKTMKSFHPPCIGFSGPKSATALTTSQRKGFGI